MSARSTIEQIEAISKRRLPVQEWTASRSLLAGDSAYRSTQQTPS